MSRFETPGLTPIPANASVFIHSPPEVGVYQDHRVLRRAQQVAARLYYQPSPETPHTAEIQSSLQYLRGVARKPENAATPNSGDTPARRGGQRKEENDNDCALPSTISSFATRKPRALFLSSENNINNTSADLGDLDDNSGQDVLPQVEKEVSALALEKQNGIKEILGLLSLLGSAWRRLCQVRQSITDLVYRLNYLQSHLILPVQ